MNTDGSKPASQDKGKFDFPKPTIITLNNLIGKGLSIDSHPISNTNPEEINTPPIGENNQKH